MLKWSRVRLYLSILTCEGLFDTLRERVQLARAGRDSRPDGGSFRSFPQCGPREPDFYDYCGAVHVHSTYSDGAGSVPEVAQASCDAGLDFVILSDHASLEARRDGLDGWQGRTLVLVGTELTTDKGHLLAIDVPDDFLPATGSAGDDQRKILDAGGIGFVALPCDLKDHWRDFDALVPGIGLEVFNLGAIARTKINLPAMALIWTRYHGRRPHRAFRLIAGRPHRELRIWDKLLSSASPGRDYHPITAIGSVDAHAVMKVGGKSYPYPTYQEVFRTLRTHVLLKKPLAGAVRQSGSSIDSAADQKAVYDAIRAGHCYIAYDIYGDSTGFVFQASVGGDQLLMGDSVHLEPSTGQVRLLATAPRSRSFLRLFRDGRVVATSRGGRLEYDATKPGVYRVEGFLYRRRIGSLCLGTVPWIFSNPIYVQPSYSEIAADDQPANVTTGEKRG